LPSAAISLPHVSPCSHAHRIALERLFDRISFHASLPLIAERILALEKDPAASSDDLLDIIRSDAALTTNVVRRVNASYTGLTRRVVDLGSALSLLGFREVRNIALTVFLSRMFDSPAFYGTYSREGLWRHCSAVAVTSQTIARVTETVPTDEAYIAGLLHHLGTILIDQYLRSHFCRIVNVLDETTPTYIVERAVLSFDQSQLSEFVARRWHFSERVCDAVRYYQYPAQYAGNHRNLVNIVAVANFLCSRAGLTSLGLHNTIPPADGIFAALGLDRVMLAIIWDEVQATIPQAESP